MAKNAVEIGISTNETRPPTESAWETVPCRSHDPEIWFAEGNNPQARSDQHYAKTLCGTCPMRAACLQIALRAETGDHWHRHGIYGGLDASERAKLAKRRAA